MIGIGLFAFRMLPEVLEYCVEVPEKKALALKNFYNLPYRGQAPYYSQTTRRVFIAQSPPLSPLWIQVTF